MLLALRWAVVAQAASLEEVSWIDALRSSANLTAEHYGHVFGVLFVGSVIGDAIKLGARAVTVKSSATIGAVILGIAADTVVASFAALTLALLYFDLKARDAQPARAPREHLHLRDLDP